MRLGSLGALLLGTLAVGALADRAAAADDAYVGAAGGVYVYDQPGRTLEAVVPVLNTAGFDNEVIGPRSGLLYGSDSHQNIVGVVDTATNTLEAYLNVAGAPVGMALLPDESRLYVCQFAGDCVSVIETTGFTTVTSISLPSGVQPIDIEITPDGQTAYVATRQSGGWFYIIDTTTNTVTGTASIGLFVPADMEMSPDGSRIYVSSRFDKVVRVFDTATNMKVADVPLSGEGARMDLSPDGTRLYAHAVRSSSSVNVIDTASNSVVATIPLPEEPLEVIRDLEVSPDGSELWLSVVTPYDRIRIFDTGTLAEKAPITSVGLNPSAIVFTPVREVVIDIKPGSATNTINLGSGGNVPVAILSSATFDATDVDPSTVTLANAAVRLKGKGTTMSSAEDVDGDGLDDLLVHIDTTALQLAAGAVDAVLNGRLRDGRAIRGSDRVTIVKE